MKGLWRGCKRDLQKDDMRELSMELRWGLLWKEPGWGTVWDAKKDSWMEETMASRMEMMLRASM